MPRRISVDERIRRLEENRKFAIDHTVKRVNAIYNARIDLLKEKGLPTKRTGSLSLEQRVDLAKDRYVFFRRRSTSIWGYRQWKPEEELRKSMQHTARDI
jgi:hypothetical protein